MKKFMLKMKFYNLAKMQMTGEKSAICVYLEEQKLYEVAKSMGIRDNDKFWTQIMRLDELAWTRKK